MSLSMFDSEELIRRQIICLEAFFLEHVTGDYVYLDVPRHMNVGDHLIAMGAWKLLEKVPHKCLMKCTISAYDRRKIKKGTIILIHGGGNFGDLYPGANDFRNSIVTSFPDNKVIFLPQTVCYQNRDLIVADAKICSNHQYLHICARDKASYDILRKYFCNNHIYLIPDTAWGLYDILPKQTVWSRPALEIRRKDYEFSGAFSVTPSEVKDWDDILPEIGIWPALFVQRVLRKMAKSSNAMVLHRLRDNFQFYVTDKCMLRSMSKYLLRYAHIYTTRLHGYIFAMMLNIPVDWIDSKFGKLSGYIGTWMNGNDE